MIDPRRRARLLPALLLLLLLLLGIASPPARAAAVEEEAAPAAKASDEDRALLEALVGQARPLVEKARGLAFKGPVPAAPVTREQFIDRYMRDFVRLLGGEERVAPASRLLARLGVLEERTDVRAVLARFLEGNIAANYDPETGRVSFLPGIPRTLPLMVHELVHALDDQHFDMKGQMATWNGHFDRMLAYGALAEGDAQSVEYRHVTGGAIAQQPLEGLRAMADGMATAILQGKFGATPPALVLAFKSQYIEGAIFVETLRRTEKGEEAVNAAFRAPPSSTEQVLHPEKFLAREEPVTILLPAPGEGARTLLSTTLGELGSRIVLLGRGLPREEAGAAAAGWAGDTVALVAFPSGEALVWVTAWDTEADAAEFYAALKRAFPAVTGEGRPTRGVIQRGTTVEFVEAPLDGLPDAVEMAKGATRK